LRGVKEREGRDEGGEREREWKWEREIVRVREIMRE
jgi:hypothetical protein